MSPAISTDLLSRQFRKVEAVRDLTFKVPKGSLYALLGPNGAGKTTTIHMLMKLLEPSSGRAAVLGVDTRRLGRRSFQRLAMCPKTRSFPVG